MTGQTPQDLEEAQKRLEMAHHALGRDFGSNSKAAALAEAASEVRAIERDLKRAGLIPSTDHELLETKLDSAFPDAAGQDVVNHDGKQYKRRFFPVRKSRTGKVVEWGRSWEQVDLSV
jgi:hypothetical protein